MANITERVTSTGEKRYKVRIRIKGQRTVTKTFPNRSTAKKWITQTEAAIQERRYNRTAASEKHTIKDLITEYMQVKLPERGKDRVTVEGELKWWLKHMGHYVLADVTAPLVTEYRYKLEKESSRKPATIVRYISSLSVCFKFAVQELGWLDDNPVLKVAKPKLKNERTRFLSDDERKCLLDACKATSSQYLYTIVLIALSTGARQGEILNLRWKNIDFNKRTMYLLDTKNGESRSVPLYDLVVDRLKQLNKVRRIETDFLFPRRDGKKPIEIKRQWLKAVDNARLVDFKFHDLRHTAASYLAKHGATLLEIAQVLGHKQLKMVKRYAHLTDEHPRALLDRMNKEQFSA